MQTCTGCIHMVGMTDGAKELQTVCTRNPPTAFLLMVQSVGGVRPSATSSYPPVTSNTPACGEYMGEEEEGGNPVEH